MSGTKSYELDLQKLYQDTFGVNIASDYVVKNADAKELKSKYGSSEYRRMDALGYYYFLPVQLGELWLHYPIIRITARKNIIETQMTERDGSVIEIINNDSFKIYIRGFIIGHDGNFPEEDVYQLKELFLQNKSVPIKSVLTDLFLIGEDKVVLTELNFPEVKGVENIKPYEISMVSDHVFELDIE